MTDSDILTYAISCGILDKVALEQNMLMKNRQKILENHKYSIWQGKDGFFYTTVPCERYSGGRRKIKRKTRADLDDAIVDFYIQENEGPSVNEVFALWLNSKMDFKEITKGTRDRYRQDFTRYIYDTPFGRRKIKHITTDDLYDFIKLTIAQKELTRKSFNGFRTLIIGIFKYAKRKKFTDLSISEFFQDLDLSKRAFRPEIKDDYLQIYPTYEAQILIDWLTEHPTSINYGILLDFYTGLRTGELIALKHTDLRGDHLHIERQQIRYKDDAGKYVFEIVDYTKTEDGRRDVFLPKVALNVMKQLKLMNPFSEYVFPAMQNQQFNKYLRKACAACGIPFRSMHKIRKTYGTKLIDKGVVDSLIMSQMGHKDIETTRKYYYFANHDEKYIREQIENAVNF